MAANAQKARYETLRTVAFSAVGASYTQVGTNFSNAVRQIEITNGTDENILISFDGINDMCIALAGELKIVDYGANRESNVEKLDLAYRKIFIKAESSLPTSGSFYVSVLYAATN